MRLHLKLSAPVNSSLSINYSYSIVSAIYSLLRFGSSEFSSFLHDKGYSYYGRTYKLCSFALRFEKIRIINNMIKSLSPNSFLFITSLMIEGITGFENPDESNGFISLSNCLPANNYKIKNTFTETRHLFYYRCG